MIEEYMAKHPEYADLFVHMEEWLIEGIETDGTIPAWEAYRQEVIRCLNIINERNQSNT